MPAINGLIVVTGMACTWAAACREPREDHAGEQVRVDVGAQRVGVAGVQVVKMAGGLQQLEEQLDHPSPCVQNGKLVWTPLLGREGRHVAVIPPAFWVVDAEDAQNDGPRLRHKLGVHVERVVAFGKAEFGIVQAESVAYGCDGKHAVANVHDGGVGVVLQARDSRSALAVLISAKWS